MQETLGAQPVIENQQLGTLNENFSQIDTVAQLIFYTSHLLVFLCELAHFYLLLLLIIPAFWNLNLDN